MGSLSSAELSDLLNELDAPGYRADQVRLHAWRGSAQGFESMANLPGSLRGRLAAKIGWSSLSLVRAIEADRGLTRKLLLRACDGQEIEAVTIRHPGTAKSKGRLTVCVSSQVGCSIGCAFCATGQLGLRRNLTPGEIVDQVLEAARLWAGSGQGAPTNVVYMGMGEPLQNYRAVVQSVRLLAEWGVPPRRVVISTSGLVPEMERLAREGLPVRLAISLHAASDAVRDRLVPLNRRYPISRLIAAGTHYSSLTGRRVSLEYVLIEGVNDSPEDAAGLRRLAAELRGHVNLIPMNSIPNSSLHAPAPEACREFALAVGPRATIRFSRGDRATAACGQLRAAMEADERRLLRSGARMGAPGDAGNALP